MQAFQHQAAGRYAHMDVVAYVNTLPVGDTEMRTLIITYGFTDLEVVDGTLMATDSYCHADQRSNQPFESEVPDEFTRAIVPPSVATTVTEVDDTFAIWRPETPTPIGIDMEDPNEPLPTDPNDPRISDDDNDGKPGVTVQMLLYGTIEAEIYIARREIFAYEVRPRDDGSLVGTVHDRSEQLIVGASHDFLEVQQSPPQYEDLTQSPIYLVPVEGDYDCERLMQERDALLPAEPAVW